ncbi:MAG: hypothetical protein M3N08_10725 [Pseudomonadota bacterium]|nr:hypothetical protein [Pseudomonadota bacterium]
MFDTKAYAAKVTDTRGESAAEAHESVLAMAEKMDRRKKIFADLLKDMEAVQLNGRPRKTSSRGASFVADAFLLAPDRAGIMTSHEVDVLERYQKAVDRIEKHFRAVQADITIEADAGTNAPPRILVAFAASATVFQERVTAARAKLAIPVSVPVDFVNISPAAPARKALSIKIPPQEIKVRRRRGTGTAAVKTAKARLASQGAVGHSPAPAQSADRPAPSNHPSVLVSEPAEGGTVPAAQPSRGVRERARAFLEDLRK